MAERQRARPLLGTFVEIGAEADSVSVDAAIDAGFAAIETIHRLASFQDPDSPLSRLNRARGREIAVHALLARMLRLARAMACASGGLFNPTVGGMLVKRGVLPDHGFGEKLAHSGTADDIDITAGRARLRNSIVVSLDGIAKGFAVDLAIRALVRRGAVSGRANAGGDLRVFGEQAVPIHRRETDGTISDLGRLQNGAVATSRVSAPQDPRFPGCIVGGGRERPESGQWSVITNTAWRADALTKVAALAPAQHRKTIITRLQGCLV